MTQSIDQATIDVVDAIEKASRALAHPHRWRLRDQYKIKQAIGLLMQVTGELENIEIGPEPASKWKTLTLKDDPLADLCAFLRPQAD